MNHTFQMSIDAQIIYEMLDKLEINEMLEYKTMSDRLKRDITMHRGVMQTARNHHYANSKVFATVSGKGLIRVDDIAKVSMAEATLKRVRNVVRKSKKLVAAVKDFDALPNELKVKHNAISSVSEVILQFGSASALKKVEKNIESNSTGVLAIGQTLAMFSK